MKDKMEQRPKSQDKTAHQLKYEILQYLESTARELREQESVAPMEKKAWLGAQANAYHSAATFVSQLTTRRL